MSNIIITNHEPFVEIDIENQKSNKIKTNCLIDTWFSGQLCIPFFKWKKGKLSLINFIDLFDKETRLLDKKQWI